MEHRFIIGLALFTFIGVTFASSYWPVAWRYQNPTSPARTTCCKETPCYDVVLTYIFDGETIPDQSAGLLEKTFANAGSNREDALRFGRDALEFFRAKYGVEFPLISDDQLLDNTQSTVNAGGYALWLPTVLRTNQKARHRLYMATVDEEAQFLNLPFDLYAFNVVLTRAWQSSGTFNQTIPAGAQLSYGFYTIDQCPPSRYGACHHSILTPNNPREKITMRFRTKAYIQDNLPPTNYLFVDCLLDHPVWGEGSARGYFPTRPGTNGIREGREVLTFPAYRP